MTIKNFIERAKKAPANAPKELRESVSGTNRLYAVLNDAGTPTDIYLSGSIGQSWFDDSGITEQEVRDAISSVPKGTKAKYHVNSEGGSIKHGLGIYNAFAERSEDFTSVVDGYALSIASIIPQAASRRVSPKSAVWMMHQSWSMAAGNADEFRKQANMLDEHDQMLVDLYVKHTGKSRNQILQAMKDETWVRGSKAVEFGLADEGDDDDAQAANVSSALLAHCKNIPTHILNTLSAPKQGGEQHKTQNTSMKKNILALLKKHGVETKDDMTDDQIAAAVDGLKLPEDKKAEPEKPKAKDKDLQTDPADAAAVNRIDQIENQLKAERRSRVQAEVARRGENRIANEDISWWTDLAINDEPGILARIDKLPVIHPGGSPVAGNLIVLAENPLEKLKKQFPDAGSFKTRIENAQKRHEVMAGDWKAIYDDALARDARRGARGFNPNEPVNANTISATVVTAFLLDGVLVPLQNMWAMLKSFTMDFSPDPYKPLATAVLKNPTVASATLTDATNFVQGNSTIAPISVTMHQYTQPFQISNTDLQNGIRMQDLSKINAAAFANKVIEIATAPVTVANFETTGGQTSLVSAPAAFGFSDMATLWGQLKKSPIKNLILDGEYLARTVNTPGFFQDTGTDGEARLRKFGWDGLYLNTDWTGAGANVRGFACNPQAIVGVMGLPLQPAQLASTGGIFNIQTITVPGLDISVAFYTYFDITSRTQWFSWDVMLGVALGDATAGVVIKSA